MTKPIKIYPSRFTERFININKNLPFSFKGREYFRLIYDSSSQMELFKTARQCAKSTFLANRIIGRCSTTPGLQVLYEAPRREQSFKFAGQKLHPILNNSPRLRQFLTQTSTGMLDGLAVQKINCFKSGAMAILSTTYNGADRDRGWSGDDLYIDETQDQFEDDIDVIAEGLSASRYPKYQAFAGTPKSEDNYIEKLWRESSQNVWMVQCQHCKHWQLPGRDNLEKCFVEKGLLCEHCENLLYMKYGEWVSENPTAKYNGWHISQLMRLIPGMIGAIEWTEVTGRHGIYDKFRRQTPAVFNNEVLGFSYDSSEKPLTLKNIKDACIPNIPKLTKYDQTICMTPIIMGIDWGRNNKNHTVVSVVTLYRDKPLLIYMRKFSGAEADPDRTAAIIKDIYEKFNCSVVYCDNGMFWAYDSGLRKAFGNDFINANFNFCQYWGTTKEIVSKSINNEFRKKLWRVSRNEILHLFVEEIKQKKVSFYDWLFFEKDQFYYDYLSVGYETRFSKDRGETLFFMNSKDSAAPTDCFHSHLYAWLGLKLELKLLSFDLMDEKTYSW